MTRGAAGTVLLVLGGLVLALALWSSSWLYGPVALDDYGRPFTSSHGAGGALGVGTFVAGAIVALLALPMAVTGARALCAIGIVAAGVALLGAIGHALATPGVAIGPGTLAAVVGATFELAGAMLVMQPAEPPPSAAPPRDGRRLIYDANGKLARIEQWADGTLQSTRAIGADGLVTDDPAPKA